VLPRLTPGADLVDIGCGTGRDSFWFAEQGRRVEGLDYSTVGLDRAAVECRRRMATGSVAVPSFASMNLNDLRQVLHTGARLAASPRAVDVYARFVADVVSPSVRADLWRLLDMAGRSGGRSFLEVRLQTSGGR
jgi:SAM-dependent methyltransferase